ncbi:hypothetical protein D9757_009403 [Collybiopsis confluens]|uniref:U3 small nucleolar RNA-associated protein 25 n=1 Tax=Collybiopsis confluens TaxID=2823264 RepID=A0A8H5HD87_9AGAR|nr:hypothetical protein D9757_009403 [Collybiopsis confluens]
MNLCPKAPMPVLHKQKEMPKGVPKGYIFSPSSYAPLMSSLDQLVLQNNLLSILSTHKDLYLSSNSWEDKKATRESIALHLLNHVTKKRRRVLKNNERISIASKAGNDPPEDVQDQGFTRPSVLVLLPFRSSALSWFNALVSHTPSPEYQIENHSRINSEYGLPPDAVDKLTSAEPGTYSPDHVETFKGNVDDNFRVGIKLTRKSVKAFTEFYGCDIIIASPLGLRQSIQKEKSAGCIDDAELGPHHLNKIPKESHDTDFSRTKPWYLDGHSEYLRQSMLLSAYETPETRHLFNNRLKNVAGKIRTEKRWPPIDVPEGVDQVWLVPTILSTRLTAVNLRTLFDLTAAILKTRRINGSTISPRRYKIRGIRNLVFYGPPDHPQFYSEYLSFPFLDDGVESQDVTCRLLYSKYDWFRLERIAGTEAAVELTKSI